MNAGKKQNLFHNLDILSLDQFTSSMITILFNETAHMATIAKHSIPSDLLKGKNLTLLFYEPSSRTYGSFASAINRLGGTVVSILNPQQFSSVAKGETLEDTIRTFQSYSEAIIMRHHQAGAAKIAANVSTIPIINAGDGVGEHPSQALLDLYTIYEHTGRLDNLTILIAGDILNGRTVHSLIRGLSLYKNNTIYLLSPKNLTLSSEEKTLLTARGITLIEITSEKDIPKNAHVWYWTRVQKERFNSLEEYEKVKHSFVVTPELMKKYASNEMILMHPLPRVGEIDERVDSDPRAVYLTQQMRNGMYVRMALLHLVLNK